MKPLLSALCLSTALCLSLSTLLLPEQAMAQSGSAENGQQRRGPGGPPPQEAFDACASLVVNDSCSIATPNETISGTCQTSPRDEQLLCVPAN